LLKLLKEVLLDLPGASPVHNLALDVKLASLVFELAEKLAVGTGEDGVLSVKGGDRSVLDRRKKGDVQRRGKGTNARR
jgi:hypothetical protein